MTQAGGPPRIRQVVLGVIAVIALVALTVVLTDSAPGKKPTSSANQGHNGPVPPNPGTAASGGADQRAHPVPFVRPAKATLQDSPHKVFAHYFPPFPLSLDNKPADSDYYTKQYLTPNGESGKHAAYGGFLRDRPLPQAPRSGHWQLSELKTEVAQAASAGIDGFTVDILSLNGPNWLRTLGLLEAAKSSPGFTVMAMPDMTAMTSVRQGDLAAALATIAASPTAFRLADGRLVVSPFAAERESPDWWSGLIALMDSKYKIKVAFVPTFLGWQDSAKAFAPISYGFSDWGHRSPDANAGLAQDAAAVHAMGKMWMQPVSVQDERPNQGIYDEAENTNNLRTTWQAAVDGGADWVQLTTWNDYSEGTEFAPSVDAGWCYLDISAYYIARFKTGDWPALTSDMGYVTHRIQPVGAKPTGGQTKLMTLRDGSSPPRDDVEALLFLTAPATVDLDVGGKTTEQVIPAGVNTMLAPLHNGRISLHITRKGTEIASATSPFTVTDKPARQDLQYYAVATGP